MSDKNYESLGNVLQRAYDQAASGKGAERHGQKLAFEDQPMQAISQLLNTEKGMAYQAIKKIQEATRLPSTERRVNELLGAINYIAGIIIYYEMSHFVGDDEVGSPPPGGLPRGLNSGSSGEGGFQPPGGRPPRRP